MADKLKKQKATSRFSPCHSTDLKAARAERGLNVIIGAPLKGREVPGPFGDRDSDRRPLFYCAIRWLERIGVFDV